MNTNLVNAQNQYIADTAVLYIKWHNLHWNVVGKQFKAIHEYIETLYDAMADVLDESAEMLKIHGEVPVASMKDFLAITTIKELPSVQISSEDAISIVIEDIIKMKKTAQLVRGLANDEDLFSLVSLMEDHITNYNKNLWFLESMVK